MSLDNFKVKGDDLIEKSLMSTEPRPMFGREVQTLLDGSGCLHHSSMPFCASHVPLNGLFTYLFFFIDQKPVMAETKVVIRLTTAVETARLAAGVNHFFVTDGGPHRPRHSMVRFVD